MTDQSLELKSNLSQFTGSIEWYRHPINRKVLYTEGVQYFAEKAGAYWLLDIIATQPEILKQAQEFAYIKFLAHEDLSGNLSVEDGNGNVIYQKKIGFTDCPIGTWDFYFYTNTIMLPSEY